MKGSSKVLAPAPITLSSCALWRRRDEAPVVMNNAFDTDAHPKSMPGPRLCKHGWNYVKVRMYMNAEQSLLEMSYQLHSLCSVMSQATHVQGFSSWERAPRSSCNASRQWTQLMNPKPTFFPNHQQFAPQAAASHLGSMPSTAKRILRGVVFGG